MHIAQEADIAHNILHMIYNVMKCRFFICMYKIGRLYNNAIHINY